MIDGKDNKLYCQNLALLTKLFIDHKILYIDIRDYQFIVLTQDTMKNGTIKQSTIVGYFSRQKGMQCANNLSCIIVFPQFMILKEMNLLKYYRGMHSLIDEQSKIQRVLYNYHKRKADKIESLIKAEKPLPVRFENKYALMY